MAVHGAVTLIALALAFLALDDITTGRQPSFVVEYIVLVVVAVWLLSFAAWLAWQGQRLVGLLSAVLLAAAVVAQRGIGPGTARYIGFSEWCAKSVVSQWGLGPGTRPGFEPAYLATVLCLAWFFALSCILLAGRLPRRAAPGGD